MRYALALFFALGLGVFHVKADPTMIKVWSFADIGEYAKATACLRERRVPHIGFGKGGLDWQDNLYRLGIEWAMNTAVTEDQRQLASVCLTKE